jgi:hypothetical protein
MNRLLIAVLTVMVFGAGYAARLWTERDRPVPPPPEAIGSEFTRPPAPHPADKKSPEAKEHKNEPVVNRATLVTDIEKARPKIEAYRKQLQQLDADFDHQLMGILTPEQQAKYIQRQKRNQERRVTREAREAADPTPLSDEQILRLQQVPLFNVLWSVTITARLERLHRDLKLEPAQQDRVRELLLVRRERFLALVDSSPPPTVSLSELATRTRKLAEPPAK